MSVALFIFIGLCGIGQAAFASDLLARITAIMAVAPCVASVLWVFTASNWRQLYLRARDQPRPERWREN
jgi:hypothetical protein